MLFNSLSYAVFLIVIYLLYWLIKPEKRLLQNTLLLFVSYLFYSFWDWKFLFLLIFSTALDYFSGIKINNSKTQYAKKCWLWISIGINLGFLGVFKYYDFFVTNLIDSLSFFGININLRTLHFILPVGISFYTFHGLSYVIDVYNERIKAERNFVDYSLFVSFFPLLVAGPIERATHLLPQLKKNRFFSYPNSIDALRQILWGLFKKIVIADQCAIYSNYIFNNSNEFGGSTLFLGAIFFAFQIYGDFSGYSDIALGSARLFGVELLKNFSFPYFSRNVSEFWRRWHISLSSWFRDYVYIPLGGSRVGRFRLIINTFFVFLISGLWHGASWNFIVWGGLNGLFVLPAILTNSNKKNAEIVAEGKFFPSISEVINILFTFCLIVLTWVFFRSENLNQAIQILNEIFSRTFFQKLDVRPIFLFVLLFLFLLTEWFCRGENSNVLANLFVKKNRVLRYITYYLLIFFVIYFSHKSEDSFIYFQF